jgi:hypothetical protein
MKHIKGVLERWRVKDKEKEKAGIGIRFQNETKYTPASLSGHMFNLGAIPDTFKEYPNPIARVSLPEPKAGGESALWKLLLKRRSRREYAAGKALKLNDLSALLWATQGLTAQFGDTFFRTAPSAGGLYPVETYLCIRAVEIGRASCRERV